MFNIFSSTHVSFHVSETTFGTRVVTVAFFLRDWPVKSYWLIIKGGIVPSTSILGSNCNSSVWTVSRIIQLHVSTKPIKSRLYLTIPRFLSTFLSSIFGSFVYYVICIPSCCVLQASCQHTAVAMWLGSPQQTTYVLRQYLQRKQVCIRALSVYTINCALCVNSNHTCITHRYVYNHMCLNGRDHVSAFPAHA